MRIEMKARATVGKPGRAAVEGRPPGRASRMPYLPGLDGLRALAVIAVMLYHADLLWLPGGFLGVEVFFVISGYLITSLLLREWRDTGRLSFKGFWLRRARRLLPAVFTLIFAMLALAVVFLPEEVASLRKDALASAGYVTNWYLILSHKSYFEMVGRPPLLQHLWSLAVEEQFYLIWPVLFFGLAAGLRRRRFIVPLLLAAAAASALLMARLYRPDLDPSRIYYGTDTRASGLLLGAALAFLWSPGKDYSLGVFGRGRRRDAAGAMVLELAGFAAVAGVIAAFVRLDEFQPFLYQGGLVVVALATVIAIAATVHPRARVFTAILGCAPLRWVGLRSYGLYLWHWPIFMLTRPQLDVQVSGLPLLALRLAATAVVVELSYRFIETPIRRGAIERAWRAWREASGASRRRLELGWGSAGLIFAAFSIVLGVSVIRAQPPAPPAYLAVTALDTTLASSSVGVSAASVSAGLAMSPSISASGPGSVSAGRAASDVVPTAAASTAVAVGAAQISQADSAPSNAEASVFTVATPAWRRALNEGPLAWEPGPTRQVTTTSELAFAPAASADLPSVSLVRSAAPVESELRPGDKVPRYGPRPGSRQPSSLPGSQPRPPATPSAATGAAVASAPAALAPVTPVTTTARATAPVTSTLPAAPQPPPDAGAAPTPAPTAAPTAPAVPPRVTAVGDSVMLGAVNELIRALKDVQVDAAVGRQVGEALDFVRAKLAAGQLGPVLVFGVGNNGIFTAKQFDEVMAVAGPDRRVIFVTVKVPRKWEAPNNAVLAEGVKRYGNAVLVDWRGATVEHPEDFWDDGIHLRPAGQRLYADMIAAAANPQ